MAVMTIEWRADTVRMIDQRLLPAREVIRTYRDYRGVAEAIRTMVIRGAPAIGVAAAMGVALGIKGTAGAKAQKRFEVVAKALKATRPTAVNLAWAVDRMGRVLDESLSLDAAEAVSAGCALKRSRFTPKTSPRIARWASSAPNSSETRPPC